MPYNANESTACPDPIPTPSLAPYTLAPPLPLTHRCRILIIQDTSSRGVEGHYRDSNEKQLDKSTAEVPQRLAWNKGGSGGGIRDLEDGYKRRVMRKGMLLHRVPSNYLVHFWCLA